MRISTDENDQGFCAYIPQPITILLDGVECRGATMADEEAGEILKYLPDRDGNLFVANKGAPNGSIVKPCGSINDDFIPMETVFGKVEVILPDGVSRDPYHWVEPLSERVARYVRRWRMHHWRVESWLYGLYRSVARG